MDTSTVDCGHSGANPRMTGTHSGLEDVVLFSPRRRPGVALVS